MNTYTLPNTAGLSGDKVDASSIDPAVTQPDNSEMMMRTNNDDFLDNTALPKPAVRRRRQRHQLIHWKESAQGQIRVSSHIPTVGVEKFKNYQKQFLLQEEIKTPVAMQDVEKVCPARPQGIWRAEHTAVREHSK